jgi:Uncharacterized conserved protein (COG2071)
MQLKTKARDCLYVNWAIPKEAAPDLPASLRYEVHRWEDRDWVFASALLFRSSGLHPRALPFLRLSYPQMNLRLYVLDAEDVPSVLFVQLLVPFWVAPVSRYLGHQPASVGWFSYPSPSTTDLGEDCWTWSLRRERSLEILGRLASPHLGPGPSLGSWDRTVDYVRRRRRGYVSWNGHLRSINRSHPPVDVWPLEVEVQVAELLCEVFAEVDDDHWHTPHSAWLCPEIPLSFELGKPLLPALRPRPSIAAVADGA